MAHARPLGPKSWAQTLRLLRKQPYDKFDLYGLYVENSSGDMSFDGHFQTREPREKRDFWSDVWSALKELGERASSPNGQTFDEYINGVQAQPSYTIIEYELEKRKLIQKVLSDPSNTLSEQEICEIISANDNFYQEFVDKRGPELVMSLVFSYLEQKAQQNMSGGPKPKPGGKSKPGGQKNGAVPDGHIMTKSSPFKNKDIDQLHEMFTKKGFKPRGPDAKNGLGSYINLKNGRKYHIDPKGVGRYNEPNHVDVSRPNGYDGPLEKKRFSYADN